MASILTTQFLETIVDNGALQLYVTDNDGYTTTFFASKKGGAIPILSSSEYIKELTAAKYLAELGLGDLIELLFPGFFERYKGKQE